MANFFRPKNFTSKGPWIIIRREGWSLTLLCADDEEASKACLRLKEMAKFGLLEVGHESIKWSLGLDNVVVDAPDIAEQ